MDLVVSQILQLRKSFLEYVALTLQVRGSFSRPDVPAGKYQLRAVTQPGYF